MTERIGDTLLIVAEPAQKCQKCGMVRETRPYGFGGMEICFPCFQNGSPELKAEVRRRFDVILGVEKPHRRTEGGGR